MTVNPTIKSIPVNPEAESKYQSKAIPEQIPIEGDPQHQNDPSDLHSTDPTIICQHTILNDVLGVITPRKPSKPTQQRPILVALIREHAQQIIIKNNGVKLLAASTILAGLHEAGHASGIKLSNGIGDCLGRGMGGLHLPKIFKAGKMRYALQLVDATEIEKAAYQTALDKITLEQRRALIIA